MRSSPSTILFRGVLISLLLLQSACATVIEGRTQKITVDTDPEGATCTLTANDNVVAIIHSTPETIKVDKSKYDIITVCSKTGYIKSKIKNHSDFAAAGIGNLVMGQWSFVGSMIDSATGAANKYDSHMLVSLDVDKDAIPAKTMAQLMPATPFTSAKSAPSPFKSPEVYASLPGTEQAVPVTPVAASPLPVPAQRSIAAPAIHIAQAGEEIADEEEPAAAQMPAVQAISAPTAAASPPVLDVTRLYAQETLSGSEQLASLHPVNVSLPVRQSAVEAIEE